MQHILTKLPKFTGAILEGLVILFVISIPFRHFTGTLASLILLFWLIQLCMGQVKFVKSWLYLGVGLFFIVVLSSYFINITRFTDERIVGHILTPMLLLYVISSIKWSKASIKRIIYAFPIAMSLKLLQLFYLQLSATAIFTSKNRLTYIDNSNIYAQIITFSCITILALLLTKKQFWVRIGLAILLLINVAGLMFTFSRGQWIGFAIASIIVLVRCYGWNRKTLLVISGLGGIALLFLCFYPGLSERLFSIFSPQLTSNTHRIILWKSGIMMGLISPLWGVGVNMFPEYLPSLLPPATYFKIFFFHAHNIYIHTFAELGFIGLFSLLFMFAIILKHIYKFKAFNPLQYILLGGFASLLISGFFDFTLFYRSSMYILYLFLGLMVSLKESGG